MNRGIFVSVLTKADVVDLYRLRRMLEGGAARLAGSAPAGLRQAVGAAVEDGEAAAVGGAWLDVRTADLHFHQAIGALAQSARVDEMMRRALAELRLVFHAMTDPEQFHAPYLGRNRVIAGLVDAGRGEEAEHELYAYLTDAEKQLLAVYEQPDNATGRSWLTGRPRAKRPRAGRAGPPPLRFLPAGPSAVLVELKDLDEVFSLTAEIERHRQNGWGGTIVDVVPGATTVLLDGVEDPAGIASEIETWPIPELNGSPVTTVESPAATTAPIS